MRDEPLYKQKKWLETQYWDEALTQKEMADIAGVTKSTISNYMRKLGIERRSGAESKHYGKSKPHDDAEWLARMYHSEGYTISEIAELVDATQGRIHNRMKEFSRLVAFSRLQRQFPSADQTQGTAPERESTKNPLPRGLV